jgi:hypothetical protein
VSHVAHLVALASQAGLQSDDSQWEKALVHWFREPMPDTVRQAGIDSKALEYFFSDATPHNPANEGFIDRIEMVAITFETGVN